MVTDDYYIYPDSHGDSPAAYTIPPLVPASASSGADVNLTTLLSTLITYGAYVADTVHSDSPPRTVLYDNYVNVPALTLGGGSVS